MADLSFFNAQDVEPLQPMTVLPRGRYNAMITASEDKPTKSGTGAYLQLEFTVIDGPCANRKVWARLNLDNPSETAVKIAKGELAAIYQALGIQAASDSAELHDKPLVIEVAVEAKDGNENNRIKAYMAAGGSTASPIARAPAPKPASPPAAKTASRPWAKQAA
jgi:hypothetical protein